MSNWGKRLFGLSLLLFVIGASGLVWLFSKQEYFSFSLAKVDEQRTISQAFVW
jgi:lia operon protein LiaG